MRRIFTPGSLLWCLLVAGLVCGAARAQEPPKTVKKVPVHSTQAIAGKDLFREFCAVCHGTAGKGDGPAASALKTPPADLTQISARNGGKFPETKIQHIIAGDADVPVAHGSKDMPVWGSIFQHMGSQDLGAVRVYNLVKYLEEMQAK
ncbi:MAG: cytochrome c [Bryobacteraceae bacterium]|jgi:mono/diheme cytochrome c family protein